MNACPQFVHRRGLCLATALCLLSSLPAAEKKSEKPATPEPAKPYVLFMGTDLAVQRDQRFYRVEDVTGSEFKIHIGQREFFVPTRNRETKLRVDSSLKLSTGSVRLAELHGGPAYTPANDPRVKFQAASGAAGGAAAVRDLGYGRMIAAEIGLAAATHTLANTPESSPSRPMVEAAFSNAQSEYSLGAAQASVGDQSMLSQQYDTAAYADKMYRELSEENYDALEMSFKISSPVELEDPYMVILFKFQEKEAKPGDVGLLIHAEALDPIGAKPKYIRVRQGGMPKGFKYVDSEVHIYNHGREVATDASSKRLELTRAEAQMYLLVEYVGAHKDATLPAAVVAGSLPSVQRQRLTVDQLNLLFHAKVAKDGSLLGVYRDEACAQPLDDPAVVAAAGEVFFKPALEKGKAVDGVARVRLGGI
jgi:hypothetical protein